MFNKKQKLIELELHQRKLNELVGDMLEKADEIDFKTKERRLKLPATWHEAFAKTCQEIVSLSETVQAISALIKKGDVGQSEKALLRCTEIARHLWKKLNDSRSAAGI